MVLPLACLPCPFVDFINDKFIDLQVWKRGQTKILLYNRLCVKDNGLTMSYNLIDKANCQNMSILSLAVKFWAGF